MDYNGYHSYVDDKLPPENPTLYGLHPNAELDFLTVSSHCLFRTLLELQPQNCPVGEGAVQSSEEKVSEITDPVLNIHTIPTEWPTAETI